MDFDKKWALGLLIFCLLGFVSAQSGDTDKAKKIREAAIFTISFVACDSPSGNQILWSIFKALRTFCAYQTLSFSSNAFRALIYIESLEVKAPSCLKLFFLSFPIALLSHIRRENDLSSCSSRFSRHCHCSLLHLQLSPPWKVHSVHCWSAHPILGFQDH